MPFEIRYAIDECNIPVIAAYTIFDKAIRNLAALSSFWPKALQARIDRGTASVIHIPFKKEPIKDAIGQFGPHNFPKGGGLGIYNDDAYRAFGFL